MVLAGDHGSVTLTLLNGAVRAVAAEHRASRIVLAGDEAAVLAVALALAGEVRRGRTSLQPGGGSLFCHARRHPAGPRGIRGRPNCPPDSPSPTPSHMSSDT